MKMMALACPGISENGGGFTYVSVLPFNDGDVAVTLPNPIYGSVSIVPPVLERDPSILLINRIYYSFKRVTFVIFI